MKLFDDEIEVTGDCKIYEEPTFNSQDVCLLAKGAKINCKDSSDLLKKGDRSPDRKRSIS